MTDKPKNPPAFPMATGNPEQGGEWQDGMTLRDYFAGQALAGMTVQDIPHRQCAEMAYLTADAMLAARGEQ